MNRSKRALLEGLTIATAITGALVGAQVLFTSTPVNPWEAASVFFSFWCTWLCTRQVRFNYVLGVVSTALLSYTFWAAGLYGSMALNLYLIPTVIYGWFIWGKDDSTKAVEHVKPKALLGYAFFTILTWAGALAVITAFGGTMALLDGWLLVGTVLAQYLLDRKKVETWLVWVAVNVVSVYVYFHSGLPLLGAQFAFFLMNALYAWREWWKTLKPVAATASSAALVKELA